MEGAWKIGDRVDCKDTENKWLAARIIDIKVSPTDHTKTHVKVTYTDFSDQYDEWIDSESDRLLPSFQPDSSIENLCLNNRVNVYDLKRQKWREARVIQIFVNGDIKIHWKGYSAKFDENV